MRGQLVFNRTRKVLDARTRTHLIRANPENEWLVAKLNTALGDTPEARLEAIPQLRALINRVKVSPADQEKGVTIEVIGRLTSIMTLATGQPVSDNPYYNVGAGEGIRTLDPNLGKVVLYP